MFNDNLGVGTQKPWESLSQEEKIDRLHSDIRELFSRQAKLNDSIETELYFTRRLLAMKFGITDEQFKLLFNIRSARDRMMLE